MTWLSSACWASKISDWSQEAQERPFLTEDPAPPYFTFHSHHLGLSLGSDILLIKRLGFVFHILEGLGEKRGNTKEAIPRKGSGKELKIIKGFCVL